MDHYPSPFIPRVSEATPWVGWKPKKHIAQGKRSDTLGIIILLLGRPVRAKALIINAFALTGRTTDYHYTQGVALGYVVVGLSARIVYRQAFLGNIAIKH